MAVHDGLVEPAAEDHPHSDALSGSDDPDAELRGGLQPAQLDHRLYHRGGLWLDRADPQAAGPAAGADHPRAGAGRDHGDEVPSGHGAGRGVRRFLPAPGGGLPRPRHPCAGGGASGLAAQAGTGTRGRSRGLTHLRRAGLVLRAA